MAVRKSRKNARSWAYNNLVGAPASYGIDHNDVEYMIGGSALDISGDIFQIRAPCTLMSSSGFTWSALLRMMRVCCGSTHYADANTSEI